MRTTTGKISFTMSLNGAFLVLWLVVQIANAFGFAAFQPPDELLVIAPALIAIINMVLRYWRTRSPIER